MQPAIDDRATIDPPPRALSGATQCLIDSQTPVTFVRIVSSNSSTLSASMGFSVPSVPALAMRMSSPPKRSRVAATAAAKPFSSAASATLLATSPIDFRRERTASSFSADRPTSITLAPSCRKSLAVASPMPPVAPVTIATLPSSLCLLISSVIPTLRKRPR